MIACNLGLFPVELKVTVVLTRRQNSIPFMCNKVFANAIAFVYERCVTQYPFFNRNIDPISCYPVVISAAYILYPRRLLCGNGADQLRGYFKFKLRCIRFSRFSTNFGDEGLKRSCQIRRQQQHSRNIMSLLCDMEQCALKRASLLITISQALLIIEFFYKCCH